MGALSAACFQPDPSDLEALELARGARGMDTSVDTSVDGVNAAPAAPAAGDGSGPGADTGQSPGGEAAEPEPTTPPVSYNCVSPDPGPYHPPGYADEKVHGPDAKLGGDDCRTCHGDQLQGCEFAVGCDNCHDGGHPDGWREDCTYCHGGLDNATGAPPNDLDRTTSRQALSFVAHSAHVEGRLHDGFDCVQCHNKPADILTEGHMFDDTPGRAEVTFAAGLSPEGVYDGNGGCSELYCHGNGRDLGASSSDAGPMVCTSCHGFFEEPENLTPTHTGHFVPPIPIYEAVRDCSECHTPAVVQDDAGNWSIADGLALHVNGQVDLSLPNDPNGDFMEREDRPDGTWRCNGTCHGAPHNPLGLGDAIGFGIWKYE